LDECAAQRNGFAVIGFPVIPGRRAAAKPESRSSTDFRSGFRIAALPRPE
jgi:hypothetical protein